MNKEILKTILAYLIFGALVLGVLCAAPAHAASVSSSVSASSLTVDRPGPVTLTWTATGAAKCTASGDWSGAKNVTGGSEVVQITKTMSFTLTCESATGPTSLRWTAPTKYTDGSTLTVKQYQVMSGPSASTLARLTIIPAPATSAVVQSPPGLTFFSLRAQDASGAESADTVVASKTVVADSATSTIKVELKIAPLPPTDFTVE